jgi:hypothetical protein
MHGMTANSFIHSVINDCVNVVIPVKAGIQKYKELDACLPQAGPIKNFGLDI